MEEMEQNVQESLKLVSTLTDKGIDLALAYGPKLLLAILVLLGGLWFIRGLVKVVDKSMDRAKVDITLQRFLLSIINVGLKFILLVIFASMIGVETASLVAMLGAAGLAVGLALQGSLSNFAGGVLILLFKPFKFGDVIEAQGFLGRVHEIQIFNTILLTMDNQKVVIPNALLSNGCIKNLFSEPTRRVDLTFGISYDDDIAIAKEVLAKLMAEDPRVLKEPGAEIYVGAHADSSINLLARPWVKSEDYWPVYFDLMEKVKVAFDHNNITIPFPQRDVHHYGLSPRLQGTDDA
ncbi:mechanosensitive ion channel family protein [Ferrimonas balearica]|uniref:mechanosensitive ion channel family protein n=1 Tax=Ferrimonas balearica TaxID=44012 RepID=UPI001C5790B9|nr:mechanosensitive ion channel domain-containing protein [Ferrimonas balearica]MBW3140658.1 mechanosensitive ion channel [Ferrimonas balearica]MBW3165365.1 mechanosensitive ion channel [Ferrimonas balearica]MBY6107537.1 mechanosensitive ion channel [Ferrimonas balearica]